LSVVQVRRAGIANAIAVAVIVIIVVAAGVAFYVTSSGSAGTTSSSSPTTAHSETTSLTPTTSSSATTTESTSERATSTPGVPASSTASPTTSSTLSSSSFTTTSTSTQSTYSYPSCSNETTYTSTTGSFNGFFNFSSFFSTYSEMAVEFNGTYNGYSGQVTSDYQIVYASSTTYKVSITQSTEGESVAYNAWVLKDGTPLAVDFLGKNYTGSGASTYLIAAMAAYAIVAVFGAPQYLGIFTSLGYIHSTGTSQLMIGPTPVLVTTYAANSYPLDINQCGLTTDFTAFSIQIGSVTGVTQPLLVGLNIVGTFGANGQTQSSDITLYVTSLTRSG